MVSQISIKMHAGDNPVSNSSVVVTPETTASEPSQLTDTQILADAHGIAAFLEGAKASGPPVGLGEAFTASHPTPSPSCPGNLFDFDSLSRSASGDESNSGDPSSSYSFTGTKMCTPRMAKELSASHPGIFIRITTSDPDDRIQEEDDCADGMTLSGFHNGMPLYYNFTR